MDRDALLAATAANHRAFFRRGADRVERFGGAALYVAGRSGTIPFPRSRSRLDDVVRRVRALRLREAGCWSLHEDPVLGTLLVARGFQWGWQPHWMALDLARLPDESPRHEVEPAAPPYPRDLPYARAGPPPRGTRHLAVRDDEGILGQVLVNPWRGVAGIYDMGVVPRARRRGIGRALLVGAGRLAREAGCSHLVLNATAEGELLYRTVGFESLGRGRSWWLHRGRRPTQRQARLVEAIGLGRLRDLEALRLRAAELEEALPDGTTPLAHAVVTGRLDVVAWILDRRPDLVSRPIEPRGGTLLHVAVEWENEELLRLALSRGADPSVRDRTWNGTPLGWAEHLDRPALAALLRPLA